MPIVLIYEIGKRVFKTKEGLFSAFKPNAEWGPYLAKHRIGTRYQKPEDLEEVGAKAPEHENPAFDGNDNKE